MVQESLKDTTVCVVGLGYVGYPLADAFSRHVTTIGYDLDTNKIDRINAEPGNNIDYMLGYAAKMATPAGSPALCFNIN